MLQKQHFLKFPVLTRLIYPSHPAKLRGFSMCRYKAGSGKHKTFFLPGEYSHYYILIGFFFLINAADTIYLYSTRLDVPGVLEKKELIFNPDMKKQNKRWRLFKELAEVNWLSNSATCEL